MATLGTEKQEAVFWPRRRLTTILVVEVPMSIPTLSILVSIGLPLFLNLGGFLSGLAVHLGDG